MSSLLCFVLAIHPSIYANSISYSMLGVGTWMFSSCRPFKPQIGKKGQVSPAFFFQVTRDHAALSCSSAFKAFDGSIQSIP